MNFNKDSYAFSDLKKLYEDIYLIISPPRCSSTAFSRVFWEQPSIGYYSHEPFEVTYFDDAGLDAVFDKLKHPLDLVPVKSYRNGNQPTGLVIKEMPYQVGSNFELLLSLSDHPIIFLIRDPRLNIHSRIKKKQEVGQNPNFPLIETGWELLGDQIQLCQELLIPYIIVDSTDFRNCPEDVFTQIFELYKLSFSPEMLSWQSCPDVNLDNLDGHHSHLYQRVLNSTGIQPATETIPKIEDFPDSNGFRDHVRICVDIYKTLRLEAERWITCL